MRVCAGRVLKNLPLKFRFVCTPLNRRAHKAVQVKRWVEQTKAHAQQAEAIRAKDSAGSGPWWAMNLSSGGRLESLSPQHRRWRATMFPFQQLDRARCPMCSLPSSNLHLVMDCNHWEIDEVKEDVFLQFNTAVLEWQGNGIPEGWSGAWPLMSGKCCAVTG